MTNIRTASPPTPMHRLRCGGLAFDLRSLPCCGARTRAGHPCKRYGNLRNGRCRMHGGASTGPRTAEGRARIRARRTTHGRYSKSALGRQALALTLRRIQAVRAERVASRAELRAAADGKAAPPPMPLVAAIYFAATEAAHAPRPPPRPAWPGRQSG
jgi:hypothetical protein